MNHELYTKYVEKVPNIIKKSTEAGIWSGEVRLFQCLEIGIPRE